VPWCDACDRFLSPSTVRADGTCPSCGRTVAAGGGHVATTPADTPVPDQVDDDEELGPIPWHLKLLFAALAVYLGFRAWQGIEWVLGK
jgi:hypothetical protein